MSRVALEFRSGSYFVSVDRETGGTREEAMTWSTEDWAHSWLKNYAPWVWENGGMLVEVES